MSFWQSPMVAAKNAVAAPTTTTRVRAAGAYSNRGDMRATRKTPAVTIVAAWIRAETGVGPSIASGSQVWRPSWADLPIAPMNSRMQRTFSACASKPRKTIVASAFSGAAPKIAGSSIEPNTRNTPMIPSAKPKSPTRLTMNALIAAALAAGRSYQKPIRK